MFCGDYAALNALHEACQVAGTEIVTTDGGPVRANKGRGGKGMREGEGNVRVNGGRE